jgi:prolyl-tRNA synthetase
MQDRKVKSITAKSENMAQWYTDVCTKAELMDYASAKGFIVYRPDGYALWEEMQKYLDLRFKEVGVRNVYLPSLIPMSLLDKEKEHIQGFAPECAVVTRGGEKELAEPMVVRPTSETLFCDHFKDIVHSYNDLPIEYNQWCSVVRWEKTTRPFLRGSEFLWQELHSLHATEQESRAFALSILRVYNDLGRDMLAVPFIMGQKPKSEKFAGAVDTYTIEGLMPDGQALQCGTTHYLGTGFMEHYGVRYLGKDNKIAFPHYSSCGASTRLIGAVILMHGDDNGLVLPPKIAPTQVVIVPIRADVDPEVMKAAKEIEGKLREQGVRVYLDASDKTPGWKFAQYEMKGVPLRIEIGPKDLAQHQVMLTRRFDDQKMAMPIDKVIADIPTELDKIQEGMYQKALAYVNSHIVECHTHDEVKDVIQNARGFAKIMWNPEDEASDNLMMKSELNATPRVLPFDQVSFGDTDPLSGNKASQVVYYDRAY